MRLACENCAAVYIIDDGAMTARGVRAQCPRCKNIQFVPPPLGTAGPSDNPATRAQAMANPISVSRPPVPGRDPEPELPVQVARVALTQRMVARPPAPPPEALLKDGPEARAELFGELSWNDGESPEASAAPVPASATPSAAPVAPRPPAPAQSAPPAPREATPPAAPAAAASAPLAAEAPFSLDELFGPAESPSLPGAGAVGSGSCARCGGALVDLEDVASGVCTPCRTAAAARLSPAPVMSSRPRADSVPPGARNPTSPPRRTASGPSQAPPRRRWLALGALALVLLLGGGAALWLRTRTSSFSLPLRPSRRATPLAALPTGFAERLAVWRAAASGPAPSLPTVLVEAQREIALDKPSAYLTAERRLQRALVESPRDGELLGAWLTAVALGRGAALGPVESKALLELGESAVGTSGRAPAVLLGLAELLLVAPSPKAEMRARELAQEVLAGDAATPAQGHLVLARTYVRTSADLALGELQKAELADPTQRRIPLLRAEAYTANGQPREALAALQARLALEPDHAASLFAMGRLLVEVGEPDQARRLFERLQSEPRTTDGPALLALAGLDSLQGRPRDAMALLRAALKRDRLTPESRVQANVLLAAAARAVGEADSALAAARAAIALEPDSAAAHLQLLLLALDRADGAAAAEQLPALAGKLEDAGQEGMVEGWVLMAQKQPAAAAAVFERTAKEDVRRTDALLWAAAAHAAASNSAQALSFLALAEEADPTRAGPWSPLSTVSVRPEESLRGPDGPLARLAQGARDPRPLVGEAVLRFHRRDFAGAEAALNQALKTNASHPETLAWRSLLLLERGEVKAAMAAAQLAQQSGRALAVVQYATGVAALAAGDLELAKRALREAAQLAPSQLAAQVKLAEAEARAGAGAAARERLRKVVQLDPSYASAKRALYLLPKEN